MARVAKITKEEVTPTVAKQNRTLPVIIVLATLLVLAVTIAGYFYYQYHNTQQERDIKEITDLTKTIGAFMELPVDETPTLATVTDKEKLAGQPFFQKAENGDKVLIYTSNGRAILYRPSTKKIVDVTMVNVKPPETAPAPEPAVTPTPTESTPITQATVPTIALYNGSTKIGVTNTLEEEIKTKFPEVAVTIKDKAVKNDYPASLVIDVSGKNADLAKKLADSIGGTVGPLPAGEAAPATDILVIVGNK